MGPHAKKTHNITTSISHSPLEKHICQQFYREIQQLKALNYFSCNIFPFHIANEQYTSVGYTRTLKSMGLTAGVADYCILMPYGKVAFIEFKRNERCKISTAQKEFATICSELGIPYYVAYNSQQAIDCYYSTNSKDSKDTLWT